MEVPSPLVDHALAEQLYAVGEHGDAAEIREMFNDCVADAITRLQQLQTKAAQPAEDAAARREIHQLRGAVGNFGMQRAADRLRALEAGWPSCSASLRTRELEATEAEMRAAAAELQRQYPFLRG